MKWFYYLWSLLFGKKKKTVDGSIDPPPTVEPPTTLEPSEEPTSTIRGGIFPDISDFRLCDFNKFKGKDLIFKATEGYHITHKTMKPNIKECIARSIRYGVYHFYRWDKDPVRQAEHFTSQVGVDILKSCHHLPVVDFESSRKQSNRNLLDDLDDLKIFIKAVNKKTGRKMRLYVGDSLLGQIKDDQEMLDLCDAPWVARYSSKPPKNDGVWDSIWAWQFTDKARIEGIIKPCDGNRFM